MAGPGRGGAEKLRSTRRAPDGALWVGRGQGSPPENVERGGERRSSQLHRDENRGDRERASLENDAGASRERRSRAGDPPLRHRHAQTSLERDPGLLLGLRALSGRGSARGGADHLPQSLSKKKGWMKTTGLGLPACRFLAAGLIRCPRKSATPGERNSWNHWKKVGRVKKSRSFQKKTFLRKLFLFRNAE